jgi:phosphate starvation-inducible PhoH-like protein
MTFAIGPAGTGKTYLAMAVAVSHLMNKKVKRLILTRPAVEAGENLGFLPGDLEEKISPYLRPLYDALYAMVDLTKVQRMIEEQRIEVAPLAFMRGRTLDHSFILLDEAQNTTSEQMKMFLTRLGQGSRAIVTGDVTQCDLPRGTKSGLAEAARILKSVPEIGMVHLSRRDVVRHPLVERIISAYETEHDERDEVRGT